MHGSAGLALFAVGWLAGWFLLARPRPLPRAVAEVADGSGPARLPASVIVPARDEEGSIGALVASVVPQLRPGDELVVVDDHSADATAAIAAAGGARVVTAPELPPGWAGKPHACHAGAAVATGEVLVFLDADVTIGPGALDAVVAEVGATTSAPDAAPARLVSVQPWHRPGSAVEQLQVLANVVALMGSAAFTALGRRVPARVAFGPVLACTRADYDRLGGHAHPTVRAAVLEDIALARLADDVRLLTGRGGSDVSFRMYPGGWRPMVEGWTKGIGIGASATRPWVAVLVAAWVASLAGGWFVSPWLGLASAAQLAVLARVAGRWAWWIVVLHPVAVVWFAAIAVRSVWRRATRRQVSWKGRRLTPDQSTR